MLRMKENPDLEIARRLREIREKRGFKTATEAAGAFRLPVSTYTSHENGSRGIGRGQAQIYSKAFKVNPEWLLFGVGSEDPAPAGPEVPLVGTVRFGYGPVAFFREGPDRDEVWHLIPKTVPAPPDATASTIAVMAGGSQGTPGVGWLYYVDPEARPLDQGELEMPGLVYAKATHWLAGEKRIPVYQGSEGVENFFLGFGMSLDEERLILSGFGTIPRGLIVEWVKPVTWIKAP